jgi:2-keto-4-pentenoate hydratase/2-oxohepta-3-ene-1,7-dioic acid hydratase in catechol pathway
MKLAQIKQDDKIKLGIIHKEKIFDIQLLELAILGTNKVSNLLHVNLNNIEQYNYFKNRMSYVDLTLYDNCQITGDYQFLPPILNPPKNIICVGKNYRDHAAETGDRNDGSEHIVLFSKPQTSLIGNRERINAHSELTNALDYEGELAVVIGKKGKNITEDEALNYVFGYTILNDVTARDLQSKHNQFFFGKSLDTFCPIGPWIVEKDDIPNIKDCRIITEVNGEIRQNDIIKNMTFSIETIISTISKGITLEPGDIIATGTPAGVGKGFNPPRYLESGDEITITINGIGTLINKVK